jgi:hypothetical protein
VDISLRKVDSHAGNHDRIADPTSYLHLPIFTNVKAVRQFPMLGSRSNET